MPIPQRNFCVCVLFSSVHECKQTLGILSQGNTKKCRTQVSYRKELSVRRHVHEECVRVRRFSRPVLHYISFIILKSCTSLYLDLSAFITGNIGVLRMLCVFTNTHACIRPETVLLTPASASGFNGYCGHLESFTLGFNSIFTGLADFTSPTSASLLDHNSSSTCFSIFSTKPPFSCSA